MSTQTELDKNPYKILMVDPLAPTEVIKAAYRAMLKSQNAHPDLGGSEEAARRVIEAYEVLSDDTKRRELDARLRQEQEAQNAANNNSGNNFNHQKIHRAFYRRGANRGGNKNDPHEYYVICLRCRGLNKLPDNQAIFYAKCGGCYQSFLPDGGNVNPQPFKQEEVVKKTVKPDEKLARHLFERGMYVRALEDYKKLSEIEPTTFRHFYMCGMCLYNMANFKHAIKYFSAAVMKNPDDFMSNQYLGNCLLKIKNEGDAIIYLKKALELKPSHFKTQLSIGLTMNSIGRYHEAVKYLTPIIKIKPNMSNVLYCLAHSYFQLGKLLHARIYAKTAQRFTPHVPGLKELIYKIENHIKKNAKHAN